MNHTISYTDLPCVCLRIIYSLRDKLDTLNDHLTSLGSTGLSELDNIVIKINGITVVSVGLLSILTLVYLWVLHKHGIKRKAGSGRRTESTTVRYVRDLFNLNRRVPRKLRVVHVRNSFGNPGEANVPMEELEKRSNGNNNAEREYKEDTSPSEAPRKY